MKKHIFIVLLGSLLMASCSIYMPPPPGAPPPVEEYPMEQVPEPAPGLDVSYFYDSLSPYGVWAYHPVHRYVWVPANMPRAWRPYTRGQWIWTDYGWTWRSRMAWGWAPFHYGRWGWEGDLGWYWVPGTTWGPCWVTWRYSDLHIGWAPLPPGVRFVPGVGIRYVNVAIPSRYWIFVNGPYFMHSSLYQYVFPYERNVTIINYTVHQTNIYHRNNRVYNEGFGHDRAQKITKKNIKKIKIKESHKYDKRGMDSESVEVYRPKIKKNENAKPKSYVDKGKGKDEISKAKKTIKKTSKDTAAEREGSMQEVHQRETKILEQSQKQEIKELERRKEVQRKAAKTETEKAKVDKDYQEKSSKIKKSHTQEKTEIKKRHEKEKSTKKEKEKKESEKKTVKKKKK